MTRNVLELEVRFPHCECCFSPLNVKEGIGPRKEHFDSDNNEVAYVGVESRSKNASLLEVDEWYQSMMDFQRRYHL